MVLISAGNLSGFECGPGELNPYEQFKTIKPTGVIQNGIYVFEGRFEIPAAAAIGHRQQAAELLAQGKPDDALIEAQRAVDLAPNAVATNVVLGDVLAPLIAKTRLAPHINALWLQRRRSMLNSRWGTLRESRRSWRT